MIRTYRFPLHPTKAQEACFEQWLSFCCFLYNAALQERRDAWAKKGVSISRYDQQKSLTVVRAEDEAYAAIPLVVQRSALERVEGSFQGFFGRVKKRIAKKKVGYPRFRSRSRYNSFSFPDPKLVGTNICVPVLGQVKINLYREIPNNAKMRQAHIVKTARGWRVCVVCDLGETPPKAEVKTSVGIDVGLHHFAVLSDGTNAAQFIPNPRFFRQAEESIADKQRMLARRVRGSKSRQRAKQALAVAYEKLQNRRLDFARKSAKQIVLEYDFISHEVLQIANMVQNRSLSKSISDAGWAIFLRCLSLKAEYAGKTVVGVDPKHTTQMCSGCGEVAPKALSERLHICKRCGLRLDRDENAARNILDRGLRLVTEAGLCPA